MFVQWGSLPLPSREHEWRADFPSSYGELSSVPRALDLWAITRSAASPTVATMAAPPAMVPPVADPSVCILTWALVPRIDCLRIGGLG